MSRRSSLFRSALVAVLAMGATLGLLAAGVWLGGHPSLLPGPVRNALLAEDVRTLQAALDIIERDYYRRVPRERLVDHGLEGAVAKLNDRFSHYFDPEDYRRFQESTQGRFSGVGLEVAEVSRGLRVGRVFPGSPAARAGIRRDDLILAVNGRSIAGEPSRVSTGLIRGPAGTRVKLTVETRGRRRVERLERAEVSAPSVQTALRRTSGKLLGVVKLSSFTAGAHGEVREAIDALRKRGARGIALDLSDNGGGLLTEAVLVSSVFIAEGTVVSTDGRNRPRRVFSATGDAIPRRVPVVVVVNNRSASASEIVAAALQDRGRAPVVGTRTFGKGVFQEVTALPNGGAIDITVGQFFTPDGRNLGGGGSRRGAGVAPDLVARDDPATDTDEALNTAMTRLAARVR